LTVGAIELIALAFGLVWTILNFYQYYPIGQAAVEKAVESLLGQSATPLIVDDADLPPIDVLLPAYEEGAVIEQSIRSVRRANYPQDRLNLFLVVEAGDDDTRTALQTLTDYQFTELVIPETYPGEPNKPRALNYGFEYTDSDIIGIVDAEDIVDPNLFREAARELEGGRDFVQGRLDMVNEGDGWLNTLFRAEYGFWYQIAMPALQTVGFPLPLSGTSCLFRRSLLIAATVQREEQYGDGITRDDRLWNGRYRLFGWTPWDPTNVTEDFELGLFLWEQGFDVGYLEATTAEESPLSFDGWMKQRTRWNKGKIQTFFKYRRFPPASLLAKAHMFWQSFLPHIGPINLAGVFLLVLIANLARYEPGLIVSSVLSIGLAFVIMSMASFGLGYWRASDVPPFVRSRRLVTITLTLPFYWLLQWAADVRAIQQTYHGHFEWEHVTHYGRNTRAVIAPSLEPSSTQYFSVRKQLGGVCLITLVGSVLRLVRLDAMSLWTDEIYSITQRGAMSISAMLFLPSDPHPPLYFVILHVWMDIFGTTATSTRLLSAIFSIFTIPALFFLGKELFDDRVGLIAAGLISISTFHIHFGRTARMYSLVGLLTVASWWYFVRLRNTSRRTAVGYLIATAALLYTHTLGVFVLLAQHGYMALSELHGGIPSDWWIKVQTMLLVLCIPVFTFFGWLIVGPVLDPSVSSPIDWIPIPSTIAVTQTFLAYLGYPSHYPVITESAALWILAGGLFLLAVLLVFLSVIYYSPDEGFAINVSWQTGQVSMLLVVPVIIPFVASYLYAPMYAPRYTLPASIGLYLLMAAGVGNISSQRVRRSVLVLILLVSVPLVGGYFATDSLEDWQTATHRLAAGAEAGDLLVIQPGWIESNIAYYYDGPSLETVSVDRGPLTPAESDALTDRVDRHDRVWVVTFRDDPSSPLRRVFVGSHREVIFRRGNIFVYRYDNNG